jgi:hypothetical protein
MTETVFYPLFLCVALALVVALERPTAQRQLVLLGTCLLGFLTRAQAVALLPAIVTAPLLLGFLEGRWRSGLRPFRLLYGIVAGAVVAVLVIEPLRGRSPYDVFGSYSITGHTHYGMGAVLGWLPYHVAELDLYLGVLPFAALVTLAFTARGFDRPVRIFVVAAVALTVWLVLEVAVFASAVPVPPRIEERNMFYVAPLFLIALLLWIERGMPRAARATAACAVVAAALPGVLPYERLIDAAAAGPADPDELALTPLWWLRDEVISTSEIALVVVAAAAILACAYLFLPARWAYALPALVLAWFVFTQERLEFFRHGFPKASVNVLYAGITNPHRDWIDRAVGRDANVAFVWSGENHGFRTAQLWENEFFNKSVGRVYDLDSASPGGLPETRVSQKTDGTLLTRGAPVRARYAVTDVNNPIAGRVVARDRRKGLELVKPRGPLRLVYHVTGLYSSDTWSGTEAAYLRPACRGGSLEVFLASDPGLFRSPQTVTARSGTASVTVQLESTRPRTLTVPLQPRGGECLATFTVSPTAVPALVVEDSTDERVLGAHFKSFRYTAP